ncbi:MAG: hypothetical protein RLZZ227_2681 [Pseudomonadota bacterium]|jgi:hypothetical protein
MIVPLLVQVRTKHRCLIRLALFFAFGFATIWGACNFDGLKGMLCYVLLVFVTYGGGTLFVFDWLTMHFNLDSDISKWKMTDAVIPFGAAFFYTLLAREILLYPFLTCSLERKLVQDREIQRAGAQR